jgi:hypothetical protein
MIKTRDANACTLCDLSSLSFIFIELQELYWRRLVEFESQARGDLPQGVIEMRKVIDGHITHEYAAHFIVAHTPV